MAKKGKKGGGASRGGGSKLRSQRNKLSAFDVSLVVFFLGSIVFTVMAFDKAVNPLNETFFWIPLIVGASVGILAGFGIHYRIRYEAPAFLVVMTTIGGAMFTLGLVTSLNRPLDRSLPRVQRVIVANKLPRPTTELDPIFRIELSNFQKKIVDVPVDVYDGAKIGKPVLALVRHGYFGYEYLEAIKLETSLTQIPGGPGTKP